MLTAVTLRIPVRTKIELEGLATLSRKSIGAVVAQIVDETIQQLDTKQRKTLESLTTHAVANEDEMSPKITTDGIWREMDDRYIQPARKRRERLVEIRVAEFHRQLGLTDKHPYIIQALRARQQHVAHNVMLISETKGQPKIFKYKIL